jgi:hypothetical protein
MGWPRETISIGPAWYSTAYERLLDWADAGLANTAGFVRNPLELVGTFGLGYLCSHSCAFVHFFNVPLSVKTRATELCYVGLSVGRTRGVAPKKVRVTRLRVKTRTQKRRPTSTLQSRFSSFPIRIDTSSPAPPVPKPLGLAIVTAEDASLECDRHNRESML